MPFIFLLLFALICLQTQWPALPSWLTGEGCCILVGTMVVASWLAAWVIAWPIAWQMKREPDHRAFLLGRYIRLRRYHFIGLLSVYLISLYLLGWGRLFKNYWGELIVGPDNEAMTALAGFGHVAAASLIEHNAPGMEIGLLAPFFAGLLLSWERFYRVEQTAYEVGNVPTKSGSLPSTRVQIPAALDFPGVLSVSQSISRYLTASNDGYISKSAYLLLQVRHQLLLVMPPIFLLFLQQLLFACFPHWDEASYFPAIVGILMMAAAFLSMPFLLRLFLGLTPLPAGPLRDRLEQTAIRLRFGYSNVLVWNTKNLFANALVTGFIPWLRYIVLTDRLIDELSEDEIEAVFGHEVGHIKHHHLLFYLAFFLTSFIALGQFWEIVKDWITQDDVMNWLRSMPLVGDDIRNTLKTYSSFGKLGLLAVFTMLVFGFLSRRCERQADLFGARTVSTDAFVNALEKVAYINGIRRDRGGWLHPTIAQRVEFLQKMRDNPALVPPFHRSIALIRWSFFVLLGVLLSCYELPRVLMYIKYQN